MQGHRAVDSSHEGRRVCLREGATRHIDAGEEEGAVRRALEHLPEQGRGEQWPSASKGQERQRLPGTQCTRSAPHRRTHHGAENHDHGPPLPCSERRPTKSGARAMPRDRMMFVMPPAAERSSAAGAGGEGA